MDTALFVLLPSFQRVRNVALVTGSPHHIKSGYDSVG
jgi:hypothetical protein